MRRIPIVECENGRSIDDLVVEDVVRLADSILSSEPSGRDLDGIDSGELPPPGEVMAWATAVSRWSMEVLGDLGVTEMPWNSGGHASGLLSDSLGRSLRENVDVLSDLLRRTRDGGGVRTVEAVAVVSTVIAHQSGREVK